MCGRFTVKMTSAEIAALYRLALDGPPHNLPPRTHNRLSAAARSRETPSS